MGLRDNYAQLIDENYNDEMCPMPPMEARIQVENYYPLGTKIEREFNKDCIVWNTFVTAFDLEI